MIGSQILRSLSARLLLPLLVIVGAALGLYAALSFHATKESFVELVGAEAMRGSQLILGATHDGMLAGRQEDVQETIQRLAEGGTVAAIRIYDTGGRVAKSARLGEIGSHVQRTEPPCNACHGLDDRRSPPPARRDLVEKVGDVPLLRQLSVIPNDKACATQACHPGADVQPILGLLDVEMSMQPLERALSRARRQTLWTMFILVVVAGGVSAGLIRRLVHRPVRQLYDGMQRIARGDLDSPIVTSGHDDLARLGEQFNRMAGEVKASREEVTRWSHRLEEKVVEKSDELQRAQRQVLHMERMASLGKLAATVAHELNNPISGILTSAKLVERDLRDLELPAEVREEVEQYLHLMQQECSRCGSVVQNLLLFARHSGGKALAQVDVNEVVGRSLLLLRHHFQISGITLEQQLLPAEDRFMIADGAQLEQALVALLVNAVEAIKGAGDNAGVIGIRLEGDAHTVTIHVSDTGVGIHPDVLPHIFEPFFSTKNQESGVGLGLSVVYGIVQRHEGTITVDSEPGVGSTFHLRLPRRLDGASTDAELPGA